MRPEINLDKKVVRRVPNYESGRYAFVEAIPLAIGIFVLLREMASTSIWVAKTHFGWQMAPIGGEHAATIMIIGALLLSVLISAANDRARDDRTANGVITTTFRLVAHGVSGEEGGKEVLRTLVALAWAMYYFYRREEIVVVRHTKEMKGFCPILYILLDQINVLNLRTERKLEHMTQTRQMLDVLGGIASRRVYRILKSRFVNNALFVSLGVFLMFLAVLTRTNDWVLGQIVLFFFTYGVTSVFLVILHLGDGIGYDPGDVDPTRSLNTWLDEIDAACHNAEIPLSEIYHIKGKGE